MYRNQRGVTLIGWAAILAIIGFFAIFAMKLVPLYTQKLEVYALLDAMYADYDSENATPSKLRQGLVDKWRAKDIDVIKVQDIEVKVVKGGHEIHVDYEHKTPFIGDLGLYIKVDKTVMIRR